MERGGGGGRSGDKKLNYYSRATEYCTFERNIHFAFSQPKSRLPNITRSAGNFHKIWSACKQHEIQYTLQGTHKCMCNTNILIIIGKINLKNAIHKAASVSLILAHLYKTNE